MRANGHWHLVGGPAQATTVGLSPCGVYFHSGSLYVAGGPAVRMVAPSDWLTTPAGTGVSSGPPDNGGLATSADLDTCGVAVDHSGNLVIAEQNHYRIGVVAAKTGTFYGQPMTAGHIYTVAGNGKSSAGRSGVPATQTALSDPGDVAVDPSGNLVIADSLDGARLRVVAARTGTFYGQAVKAGDIYRVAGYAHGLGYSGDGGPATKAALGKYIGAVRVDRAGNLVFADSSDNSIRVVAAISGTFYGQAMTAGDIYTVAGNGTGGFSGDGGPATAAELDHPLGVTLDAAGNLMIADTVNHRVRVVAASTGTFYGQAMTVGDIYTVAGGGTSGLGDGGPALAAELGPEGVAVDHRTGNVMIADTGDSRVRVVAASTGTFYGQAMTMGDIYTVAGNGTDEFSGDGGPATAAELGNTPQGVTLDAAGNLVIADEVNQRIRVVAASTGTFYGHAMTARDIYTVAGNGTLGFSGDGGPATSAELIDPAGVAVDGAGNLLIADQFNHRVRVVAATSGTFYGQAMTVGNIYTVAGNGTPGFSGDGGPATAAELRGASGVAVDGAGNLLIADQDNERVRVVAATSGTFYGQAMTTGDIYTVAGNGTLGFSGDGGPGTSAELSFPAGVAVDGAGNLLIADTFNNRVRVVAATSGTFYGQAMTTGDIYTVAGGGTSGLGDGGPGTSAELSLPADVAVDSAGNLVIADTYHNRVRVVAAASGTFYGQAMTARDIYTVAGNGTLGFSGDGAPATAAELNRPYGVGVNSHGGLLITDNRRMRMVTG